MPQMTISERSRAIGMLEAGTPPIQVAATFGVSRTAINKLLRKWQQHLTVERLPGTGRRPSTTAAQDLALVQEIRRDPFQSAQEAAIASGFPASVRTTRRRIAASGLKNRSAEIKEILLPRHKEARVQYATNLLQEPIVFWDNVVFMDEKTWQSTKSGKVKVYRPDNMRYDPQYVCQRPKSGRFSVHAWGWMSINGPGVIWEIDGHLTGQQYKDILENVFLPSVSIIYPNGFKMVHDNSPIHTSRVVREWIGRQQNVQLLPHPPRSPDLNPIENLWGVAQRQIENLYQAPPRDRNELWTRVENAWEDISVQFCQNSIQSMPGRLQEVIDRQGNWTNY